MKVLRQSPLGKKKKNKLSSLGQIQVLAILMPETQKLGAY